jgi:uncharacterized protein (TIGR03083 family)
MAEPIVDELEEVWTELDRLCDDFGDEDWSTPTALPGWTVQDCLSHVIGTERMIMGDPAPNVPIDHLDHVRNAFGEVVEVWVEERRPRTGAEVLAEYREQIARRLDQLRSMAQDEMSEMTWSPLGEVPYREFMKVRVFDCWMHEQDIRRALDRPGHLEGPAVETALERMRDALGYVVGKKAGAPQSSSVVFRLDGSPQPEIAIVVDGRARVVERVPESPTVRIDLPFETFVALGGGRWSADEAMGAGSVLIEGDQRLGRAILDSMAFTP